jgi:hypothetical protein
MKIRPVKEMGKMLYDLKSSVLINISCIYSHKTNQYYQMCIKSKHSTNYQN